MRTWDRVRTAERARRPWALLRRRVEGQESRSRGLPSSGVGAGRAVGGRKGVGR